MMSTLAELLKYDTWANDRTLQALESIEPAIVPPHTIKLMAHLMAAGSAWLNRILGLPPELPIWPELTLAESRAWQRKLAEGYKPIVERTDAELSEVLTFKNSTGMSFSNTPHEMLLQVLTHGCYHRGQIARELRLAGLEPVNTDYIVMLRTTK